MLMTNNESLVANRRGIVQHFADQEKPTFSPEELIENRRRGISYSCIGKKLGIDNTKEEVVNVFKVMKECDDSLPSVDQLESPIVKAFPTPLWILFDSEIDLLVSECTPSIQHVIASAVQERVFSRLGERASEMLTTYIEVNEVLKEEMTMTISNASDRSPLGKHALWSNNLHKKVLTRSFDTSTCVAKAALQHSDTGVSSSVGRCQCGGVKALKWKCDNVGEPSFFWGCARYRMNERFEHDKAISFRSANLELIVGSPQYSLKLSDGDLSRLIKFIENDEKNVKDGGSGTVDLERIRRVYGGVPDGNTSETLVEYIHSFAERANVIMEQRQSTSNARSENAVLQDTD